MTKRWLFWLCAFSMFLALLFAERKASGPPFLHLAKGKGEPWLLVWLHPGSGKAAPEFRWWTKDRKVKDRFTVLAPQAKARLWQAAKDSKGLAQLIKKTQEEQNIPPSRTIIGGHSAGAVFIYEEILKKKVPCAALVVACGFMRKAPPMAKEGSPKVLVYHSPDDQVFEFANAERAVKELKKKKYEVTFLEDSNDHSIGPKLMKEVLGLTEE